MPCQPLTLFSDTGTSLTNAQMDENLRRLRDAINANESWQSAYLFANGQLKEQKVYFASSVSGSDDYAVTLSPAPASLAALTMAAIIVMKADVANVDENATLQPNAFVATPIKKQGTVDLEPGDIAAGEIVELVYDGTNFQLLGGARFTY